MIDWLKNKIHDYAKGSVDETRRINDSDAYNDALAGVSNSGASTLNLIPSGINMGANTIGMDNPLSVIPRVKYHNKSGGSKVEALADIAQIAIPGNAGIKVLSDVGKGGKVLYGIAKNKGVLDATKVLGVSALEKSPAIATGSAIAAGSTPIINKTQHDMSNNEYDSTSLNPLTANWDNIGTNASIGALLSLAHKNNPYSFKENTKPEGINPKVEPENTNTKEDNTGINWESLGEPKTKVEPKDTNTKEDIKSSSKSEIDEQVKPDVEYITSNPLETVEDYLKANPTELRNGIDNNLHAREIARNPVYREKYFTALKDTAAKERDYLAISNPELANSIFFIDKSFYDRLNDAIKSGSKKELDKLGEELDATGRKGLNEISSPKGKEQFIKSINNKLDMITKQYEIFNEGNDIPTVHDDETKKLLLPKIKVDNENQSSIVDNDISVANKIRLAQLKGIIPKGSFLDKYYPLITKAKPEDQYAIVHRLMNAEKTYKANNTIGSNGKTINTDLAPIEREAQALQEQGLLKDVFSNEEVLSNLGEDLPTLNKHISNTGIGTSIKNALFKYAPATTVLIASSMLGHPMALIGEIGKDIAKAEPIGKAKNALELQAQIDNANTRFYGKPKSKLNITVDKSIPLKTNIASNIINTTGSNSNIPYVSEPTNNNSTTDKNQGNNNTINPSSNGKNQANNTNTANLNDEIQNRLIQQGLKPTPWYINLATALAHLDPTNTRAYNLYDNYQKDGSISMVNPKLLAEERIADKSNEMKAKELAIAQENLQARLAEQHYRSDTMRDLKVGTQIQNQNKAIRENQDKQTTVNVFKHQLEKLNSANEIIHDSINNGLFTKNANDILSKTVKGKLLQEIEYNGHNAEELFDINSNDKLDEDTKKHLMTEVRKNPRAIQSVAKMLSDLSKTSSSIYGALAKNGKYIGVNEQDTLIHAFPNGYYNYDTNRQHIKSLLDNANQIGNNLINQEKDLQTGMSEIRSRLPKDSPFLNMDNAQLANAISIANTEWRN